jgi:DNA-binding Lrp family transcriptional regulator
LLGERELTNRELADRLDADPATVLQLVRTLVEAGFAEQLPPRTGKRGAREKPYRSTGATWWLEDPLADAPPEIRFGPVGLALTEAVEAGPEALRGFAMLALHLSEDEAAELEGRLLEILDHYVATDHERAGRPGRRRMRAAFVLHDTGD